ASALRRLTDQDLEETVSTRLLVVAARLVASGLPELAAGRVAIVDALTDDAETAAALNEVVLAAFHPGD
nr:CbbQ/NirQ/NorQ C-terminal domain-containing protein [Ottowia sp.]